MPALLVATKTPRDHPCAMHALPENQILTLALHPTLPALRVPRDEPPQPARQAVKFATLAATLHRIKPHVYRALPAAILDQARAATHPVPSAPSTRTTQTLAHRLLQPAFLVLPAKHHQQDQIQQVTARHAPTAKSCRAAKQIAFHAAQASLPIPPPEHAIAVPLASFRLELPIQPAKAALQELFQRLWVQHLRILANPAPAASSLPKVVLVPLLRVKFVQWHLFRVLETHFVNFVLKGTEEKRPFLAELNLLWRLVKRALLDLFQQVQHPLHAFCAHQAQILLAPHHLQRRLMIASLVPQGNLLQMKARQCALLVLRANFRPLQDPKAALNAQRADGIRTLANRAVKDRLNLVISPLPALVLRHRAREENSKI
jgi:hypothetical protein